MQERHENQPAGPRPREHLHRSERARFGGRPANSSLTLADMVNTRADENETSVLGKGASFDGKLTFEGRVRIDGMFSGEVRTDGTLHLGPTSEVKAEISTASLIVEGTLSGNVVASRTIEIRAPAIVHGDLRTRNLDIQKGAVFEGNCHMEGQGDAVVGKPVSSIS